MLYNKLIQLIIAFILLSSTGFVHASLIGDEVGCNVAGAGICSSATATVGGGVEFQVGAPPFLFFPFVPFIDVNLGDSAIDLDFIRAGLGLGSIINLTDLDWVGQEGKITNVLVDGMSDFLCFGCGVSFTDNSVALDLGFGAWRQGGYVRLSLEVEHSSVPEPATISLLGLGLGFVLISFKRKLLGAL